MTTKKADKLHKSADICLAKLKETTKKYDSIRDCVQAMKQERTLFVNNLDTACQKINCLEHELSIMDNTISEMEVDMDSIIEQIHISIL